MWFGCTGYACIRVAWFVPPTFAVVAQSVCPYHWPLRTTTRPFGHLCWRHVAGLPRRAAGWTFGPPCPGYFASVHRAQRLQCAHRLGRGLDEFVGITSFPGFAALLRAHSNEWSARASALRPGLLVPVRCLWVAGEHTHRSFGVLWVAGFVKILWPPERGSPPLLSLPSLGGWWRRIGSSNFNRDLYGVQGWRGFRYQGH